MRTSARSCLGVVFRRPPVHLLLRSSMLPVCLYFSQRFVTVERQALNCLQRKAICQLLSFASLEKSHNISSGRHLLSSLFPFCDVSYGKFLKIYKVQVAQTCECT